VTVVRKLGAPAEARRPEGAPVAGEALVRHFLRRAEQTPDAIAYRYKRLGLWKEVTWADFCLSVSTVGEALMDLGVTAGDRISVMSRARPEWLILSIAAQGIGAAVVGHYLTTEAPDLSRQLDHATPALFVAEGLEQLDRLAEAESLAGRQLVNSAMMLAGDRSHSDDPRLRGSVGALVADATASGSGSGRWLAEAAKRTDTEVTHVFFGAGTSGVQGGYAVTSQRLTAAWLQIFSTLDPLPSPRDRVLASMPTAHYAEVGFSIVCPLVFGVVVHFPEDEASAEKAVRDVRPTLMYLVPRVLKMRTSPYVYELSVAGGLKGRVYAVADRIRRGAQGSHRPVSLSDRVVTAVVMKPLLKVLGLDQLRYALVGGAVVPADVVEQWRSWGIPLQEFYGSAEIGTPAIVFGDEKAGFAQVLTVELGLSESDEILVKAPGIPAVVGASTPAPEMHDGWYATGDQGEVADGRLLRASGRVTDQIRRNDGQRLSPYVVEQVVGSSAYVSEVVAVPLPSGGLGCLVVMDFDTLVAWARDGGINFTTPSSLIETDEVRDLVAKEIDRSNAALQPMGIPLIEKYSIADIELSSGGVVTPLCTIKRGPFIERFGDLIGVTPDAMSSGRSSR
jgi:long-chain acyl-CoA synthetase